MIKSALPLVGAESGFVRSLHSGFVAVALALSCTTCGGSPPVLTAFRTEQQAQEHCSGDAVVWVDPQSGTFQLRGMDHTAFLARVAMRAAVKQSGRECTL